MAAVKNITSTDEDTIETVEVFKNRLGIATYSRAMDKLIQRAKEHGLHKRDIEPGALEQPRQVATSQT
jgi:hypothetical protein